MGTSIIDSKMFRVRYVCNNVTMTTEDSPPTDIETVHIAYAFFFTSNLSCYTKYYFYLLLLACDLSCVV